MNKTEPLGLPRGSVRAILTIILLLILGATLFIPTVPGAGEVRGGLIAIGLLAIRSYFETREKQNDEDGPVLQDPEIG